MCAIVDANIASEVFGANTCPASEKFLEWVNKGRGRLVVGGKLLEELEKLSGFREWSQNARLAGIVRTANEDTVNARAEQIRDAGTCQSDDPHVIALAQISGARLLYSNDKALHQDFKRKILVDSPRGKVYSTVEDKSFKQVHQKLLGMKGLCLPTQ